MPTNVMIMVITIVAITTAASVVTRWLKVREKEAENKGVSLSDDQEKKIKELEERVQTLERIATDKSERLRAEIDGL